jgi:hypothetical protein
MKLATNKDLLEFGEILTGRNVKKDLENFKKSSTFQESEFILFDFGYYLGFNQSEVKNGYMKLF